MQLRQMHVPRRGSHRALVPVAPQERAPARSRHHVTGFRKTGVPELRFDRATGRRGLLSRSRSDREDNPADLVNPIAGIIEWGPRVIIVIVIVVVLVVIDDCDLHCPD